MSTYALIHGASSAAFYWDEVATVLIGAGHSVVAPDLPIGDPGADFVAYADAVDAALAEVAGAEVVVEDMVVVGQSMGAITAPIVASRHPGARMILVAPMIPLPREAPGEYVQRIGLASAQQEAARDGGYDASFDVERILLHDVAPEVVEKLMARGEPEQAETIFGEPLPLDEWPPAATRVIACTQDRMFPFALVQRVASQQLGVQVEPLHSGHLPGFAHPHELAHLIMRPRIGEND